MAQSDKQLRKAATMFDAMARQTTGATAQSATQTADRIRRELVNREIIRSTGG